MISVAEFQAKTEQMHAANVARVQQLVLDAETKSLEATDHQAARYWQGFADGLRRTLRVLDGHG